MRKSTAVLQIKSVPMVTGYLGKTSVNDERLATVAQGKMKTSTSGTESEIQDGIQACLAEGGRARIKAKDR